MDHFEMFERLGLAVAIGAAVGVERHWREREERQGARTAGIRTFTMIGMLGGVAGLLEHQVGATADIPGVALAAFLLSLAGVMALFELRESIAEQSYSVTSVIAAMLTFSLGALSVLGDMVLASAGGAALVAVLASREFLHAAIRRLRWSELRSAVILLAMTFVLLPIIPDQPLGPFGGVSPRSVVVLAILLASISFVGYIAVRLLGASHGNVVAGAIAGLISSTGATVAFARRSATGEPARQLAAGAVSAGAVSLARTALLVATLADSLAFDLVPPLVGAALVMVVCAAVLAYGGGAAVDGRLENNPFELGSVGKMALLLIAVAFAARAASQFFGQAGLLVASGLAGLADVDAATVTVAGMLGSLTAGLAVSAIGVAVVANMLAKAVYASIIGRWAFALPVWIASVLGGAAALAMIGLASLFGVDPKL